MPIRPHFFDLDPSELRRHFHNLAIPSYRADQLTQWVYRRGVSDIHEMTDVSRVHQERITEHLRILDGRVHQHQLASDGVQKLLLSWGADAQRATSPLSINRQTECVMIPAGGPQHPRTTACVSSQVGCPVGCRFCASGIGGKQSDLRAGQIVEQVWQLGQLDGVERISHVVFMGMGEPLANFDQVVRAVRILMADWGFGLSGRRITVSTVGLPAPIRRLADLQLPITLAISLHASNDRIRRDLIPWAEHVTIEQLVAAGRYYFEKTGREVTLEYILLGQVNDEAIHARELARVAEQLRCHVNLIRYNEVKSLPFSRPATERVHRFQSVLREEGVNTHIRASRGRDIAAACGQLRLDHQSTRSARSLKPKLQ